MYKTCELAYWEEASKRKDVNGNLRVLHVAKNTWNILDNDRQSEALGILKSQRIQQI